MTSFLFSHSCLPGLGHGEQVDISVLPSQSKSAFQNHPEVRFDSSFFWLLWACGILPSDQSHSAGVEVQSQPLDHQESLIAAFYLLKPPPSLVSLEHISRLVIYLDSIVHDPERPLICSTEKAIFHNIGLEANMGQVEKSQGQERLERESGYYLIQNCKAPSPHPFSPIVPARCNQPFFPAFLLITVCRITKQSPHFSYSPL